eukprot:469210_1
MHSSRSQQITECYKIMDLSQTVDKLDEFREDKCLIFPVISVDKMDITAIALFPKYSERQNGYCGFVIRAINGSKEAPNLNRHNHYRISVIAQCGETKYSFNESLENMGPAFGWSAGFTLDQIKQHKKISIRLVLNQNTSSVKLDASSFFNQLEN